MKKLAAILALVLACAGAREASAYAPDTSMLLFADENGSGYRHVAAVAPAAGDDVPLTNITFYPAPDQPEAVDFTLRQEDSLWTGRSTTVMLHTNIPLSP